jgi:hypothetical protein
MKITRTAAAGALLAIASVLAVAACGPTVSKTPASPATHASSQGGSVPASAAPSPSTSAPVTTGPLGTTFTVTTTDQNENPASYNVTAGKVDQDSALVPYDLLSDPSDHLAAVRFTITGVTGQAGDDANSDATAIDGSTNEYTFADNSTPDGGNFSYGDFNVGPGQTETGWVTFDLPAGQKIASVQWSPGGGASTTWTLAS